MPTPFWPVAPGQHDERAPPARTRPHPRAGALTRQETRFPGYRESLADRTGNTGLAQLEYSRQATGSGAFAQRNRENVQAVDSAVQALAPDGQPGLFRQAMSERRSGLQQAAATDAATAQARFDEAAARLQSVMHADARGADNRTADGVFALAAWKLFGQG